MIYKAVKRFAASQDAKAFLIIFIVLLLAYAIPFAMHRSQNPVYQRAGLSAQIQPGHVSGQNTIDPNDGFTSQALGHAAAESWLSGDVPYWNHYEGLGAPLAGGMQAAAFFPPVLLLHFANGLVYFHFLLQLVAGMAMYLFFRKLKVKFSFAVLGGVLFALNGAFAWLTNAPFNPIAFLPLLLLAIEHAITYAEKKKRGGWIPIAFALSLSLYAGFPETAFINALFAYGWGATRLLYLNKKVRKPYVYKILLGSVAGLLLAAPPLLAFLGYLPHAVTGAHGSGGFADVGLPIATLPALFMPYVFGPIFGFVNAGKPQDLFLLWSNVGGYLTMPLLLAGLFGLYAKRPRGLKVYLALFSLIVILKIYVFAPVSLLINIIPGMDQVAFYRYSVPALSFAIIVLAVFGLEAVAKQQIRKRSIIALTALVSVCTLVLAQFARGILHQLLAFPSHRWWAVFSVCGALSVIVVIVLVFLKPRFRVLGLMLLLGITAFAMYITPLLSLPKMSQVDQAPVSYLQKNIGLNRFYSLHPIAPNYGSYFKIASLNTNDLPVPKAWSEYVPQKLDSNANALVFTGYSRTDPSGPTTLEEFGRNIRQFENSGVKYLVADHTQVKEDFSQQYGLRPVFSDTMVDIFELPQPKPYYESSSCKLSSQSWDTVVTDCQKQTTIERRELYMPGWSASVNGLNRQVNPHQEVFQKVDVPAGKSTVKFVYNPPLIWLGYVAFALGIVMIAAGYFLRTVKLK